MSNRRFQRNLKNLLQRNSKKSNGSKYRSRRRSSSGQKLSGNIFEDRLRKIIEKEVLSGISVLFQEISKGKGGSFSKGPGGGGESVFQQNKPVFSRDTGRGGFDQRHMEVMIDQMVASSLLQGKQTSSVLRSLFGLVPSLIGR